MALAGLGNKRRKRQPLALLEKHGHDGHGLPAEAIGIFRAGGDESRGKTAGERIDPVRHADTHSLEGSGKRVSCGARQIMLGDGVGDPGVLPEMSAYCLPMTPWSLGNSPTTPVMRSALHRRAAPLGNAGIRFENAGQVQGELLDAFRLVIERAELFLVHDLLEAFYAVRKLHLHVVVEEIGRIGQARREHPARSRPGPRPGLLPGCC